MLSKFFFFFLAMPAKEKSCIDSLSCGLDQKRSEPNSRYVGFLPTKTPAVLGHRARLALFPGVELPYPDGHWLVEAKHSAVIESLADAKRKLTLESQRDKVSLGSHRDEQDLRCHRHQHAPSRSTDAAVRWSKFKYAKGKKNLARCAAKNSHRIREMVDVLWFP